MSVLKKVFAIFCIIIDFCFYCRLRLKQTEKIIKFKLCKISSSGSSSNSNSFTDFEEQHQSDLMDLFLKKFFEDIEMIEIKSRYNSTRL